MTDKLKRYFFPLDPGLPDEERVRLIKLYDKNVLDDLHALDDDDAEIPVHPEDSEVWRGYTQDTCAEVRALGVDLLCENGPVGWDDLETWTMDQDEKVRSSALFPMHYADSYEVGKLCDSDRPRCVSLLARVARQYDDYGAMRTMSMLAEEDSEWLELTWRTADGILDSERPSLNTAVICSYLEHVIPDNNWGPDDPHIKPWIAGYDPLRKMVLLKIANYWGLEEGRLHDITEALAGDSDPNTATTARGILDGTIKPLALWRDDEG